MMDVKKRPNKDNCPFAIQYLQLQLFAITIFSMVDFIKFANSERQKLHVLQIMTYFQDANRLFRVIVKTLSSSSTDKR